MSTHHPSHRLNGVSLDRLLSRFSQSFAGIPRSSAASNCPTQSCTWLGWLDRGRWSGGLIGGWFQSFCPRVTCLAAFSTWNIFCSRETSGSKIGARSASVYHEPKDCDDIPAQKVDMHFQSRPMIDHSSAIYRSLPMNSLKFPEKLVWNRSNSCQSCHKNYQMTVCTLSAEQNLTFTQKLTHSNYDKAHSLF